jgi:hypothetical protein
MSFLPQGSQASRGLTSARRVRLEPRKSVGELDLRMEHSAAPLAQHRIVGSAHLTLVWQRILLPALICA